MPHAVVNAVQDALAKEQLQALEEWLAPLREQYPDIEVVEQVSQCPLAVIRPRPENPGA